MEFTKVVAERYSCKNFSTRKVEAEKLTEILEAGRLAPTAKNSQEQRIYVLQSEESLAKLDKVTPCRYGAPTCLVVAFDKNNVFTYPGGKRDSGMEDAAIVATHLMLAAANAGVDSCWLNFFDPDELAKELGLPEKFLIKPPSDGLTGLTDEDNLGFTYHAVNEYVRKGVVDPAVKEKIDRLHRTSRFKFQLMPVYHNGLPMALTDETDYYK